MVRIIRHAFVYWLARGVMAAVALLPVRAGARAGRALGAVAHRLARRERLLARGHLALAFGLDPGGRRADLLARGVFAHLGASLVEISRLMARPGRLPAVEIPAATRRALDEALAAGRGAIFATGHLGNWELMAVALARAGYPISTVARESRDPRFTRLIASQRARFGVECIFRGRPGAVAGVLRALKRGRILGLLIDQDTRVPGVFVPFFGRAAFTPVAAAAIALRTGAPVVVGSIRRRRDGGHEVTVEPCALPAEPRAATALITARFEERVRRRPSQWVWFHERWRTIPA
jgi:KDO2-lipid IV(A) lauroyltransferase